MNRLFFLFLVFVTPYISYGQIKQSDRVEFPLGDNGYNHKVINAGEKGLFVMRQMPSELAFDKWEIFFLDNDFEITWRKEYSIEKPYDFVDYYFENDQAFVLFSTFSSNAKALKLLTFNTKGSAFEVPIKNYIPFSYFDFVATQESILISGHFNYRPVVILYNFTEKIPRVLPGVFLDDTRLIELKVNDNNTYDVMLAIKNLAKQKTLILNTFDQGGNLVKQISLKSERAKGLLFGRSETLNENDQIIAGVYGRNTTSGYTRGVFVANVNELGEQRTKFYNYADLKNFFRYMRAKREKRVLNRIDRRRIKGKKLKFNYRFIVHELIEHEGDYVMLGEAFYPRYKSVSNSGAGFFGLPTSRGAFATNLVFDGYRYTHAVVIGFDKNGKLLWDNSFEINDVVSFELEQFVQASVEDDKIILLYVYEDKIRSKIIKGNEVLEGKELNDVMLKFSADRAVEDKTDIQGLQKWYNDTFYIYGTQQIVNTTEAGAKLRRDVFFINKVVYE